MSDCATCIHADKFGEWPTTHKGTHCRDCHRSWTSLKEAHCRVCHQHFSADSVADSHEPYCTTDPTATVQSMQEATRRDGNPIFDQRDRKHGPVWIRWSPATYEGTP
ncbi:MAG TPA: hypothetical protein VIG24_04925 [Acidimicrobiia bacterium]